MYSTRYTQLARLKWLNGHRLSFLCASEDGTIYRGRPLDVVGARVQGMNSCSIGICAEGDYHTKEKDNATSTKEIYYRVMSIS